MSCTAARLNAAAPRCSAAARRAHVAASPPSRRVSRWPPGSPRSPRGAPRAAHAYGGSGNIRATDEGSGNPTYEDLVAALKERGAGVRDRHHGAQPPAKGKCSTGREAACK
jgi:hypothetical protein